MSETTVEELLQSTIEKESSQRDAVSSVTDTSAVKSASMTDQIPVNNKDNLIDNNETEVVIDKDSCSVEQLDNSSSCRLKTSEEISIIDKQNTSSDIESEESQHSGATEIFIPPEEFRDAELDEANLISLDTTNSLPSSVQDHKDHFKNSEFESHFVDKMPVLEEATNLLDYNSKIGKTIKTIQHDKIEESNAEVNKEKVFSENHPEENLIDLGNLLSNLKGSATNEAIQVTNIEESQCDNNGTENIEKIESVCNEEVDLSSATEKEFQESKQDETADVFERKNEDVNISKYKGGNVLIQIEDDLSTEKILKNENSQFEKLNIDPAVNLKADNKTIPICQSFVDNSLQQLVNKNDSSEMISNNHSESQVHIHENQLTSTNDISVHDNNVNNELSLDSERNSNSKEALSIETPNIDMTVNQLKHVQEHNTAVFKISEIESNNEVSSLKVDNQIQAVKEEFMQDETTGTYSGASAVNCKEDDDSLEVESNSEKNQSSDAVESLSVIEDEMSNSTEKDISEYNCGSVNDNLMNSAEVVLQKNEKKDLQETANLLTLGQDSTLEHNELEEKTVSASQKLIEEVVTADSPNNPVIVDNSNEIEDEKFVEDKKLIKEVVIADSPNNPVIVDNSNEIKDEKFVEDKNLIEEVVTADSSNNPIIVDNSNKIEDEKFDEDKKPIIKNETTLKIDSKNNSDKSASTVADTLQFLAENKDLSVSDKKPETLINTLQCMKWLKSGQCNEGNQITHQLKSLPKKNERADENLFDGTVKKNNKRRRSGHNKNDKAKTTFQLNSLEGKNLQYSQGSQQQHSQGSQLHHSQKSQVQQSQGSQLQTRNEQTKNEAAPSVWKNDTAKQLFPNHKKEADIIDRLKEEENFSVALVESICTAQQESERRKMSGANLKIKILDEPDDDQWGKVHRNLPNDGSGVDQCTPKGVIDKYGRVDGYSEKHIFMGKNARRKEQEFLKSQTVNKPYEGFIQAQSSENISQVMPIQKKQPETNVSQSKQSSRSETTIKSQNIEAPKKDMNQASKYQERPIHGRAGNEGPPGQAELQKPGFNQSTNKDIYQNVQQGQNFSASQNATKIQESSYRNQQLFGQQRYRLQDNEKNGNEKNNVQQNCFTGFQDVKQQENIDKVQSAPGRNQGQSNQNQSQCIKGHNNSNQANKGQNSDQLSKGQTYSGHLNKNLTNNDSLKKNQIYTDRSENDSTQNQNCLKQNQAYSNKNQENTVQNRVNSGPIQNKAGYERNQGIAVKSQSNPGHSQNQIYSDKAVPKLSCIPDNSRQQSNFSTNQGSSNQKQTNSAQGQNYNDKIQCNAYRDQENFGRNQNYYDKDSYNSQRYQNDCKRQERNQDRSQDRFNRQGYTDNVTKNYDRNYNGVQNTSDRNQGYQNYSERSHGNYNSDRSYNSRLQDSHNKYQNSDNNKINHQNQYYYDRNNDSAYKSYENYRGSQSQNNQKKNLGNYGKNQGYGNKQENTKSVKENQNKTSMEENWDEDQSTLKCSQQVYNQRPIMGQDSKSTSSIVQSKNNSSSNILENKKVSMEKAIRVEQTAMSATTTYKEGGSSQLHLPSNKIVKTVQDIKPELVTVKKVDVEPKPNIVMAFDGNVNIQRALGLDPSINYNQSAVSTATTSVSTTLSQLLNCSASQNLPLTQTSAVSANYDTAVMCAGGVMNVNAPPFNSANFSTASLSKDLEPSFVNSSLDVSEAQNPPSSRIANSSEEILQAHKDVTVLAKKLAAAEAKLLALNVKFYNENMVTLRAQNSATLPNDGTTGEIQTQQQPQSRLLHPVTDFVAVQHTLPPSFQVPTSIVQNVVSPVSFEPARNYTTDNMPDMPSVAYQLNAAFQQRLGLQSMYVPQSSMYQPQTAASYQPQSQPPPSYQPQPHPAANFQPQAATNYQQYNVDLTVASRLHRGSGTPPSSEQKDLRTGGHQFYN